MNTALTMNNNLPNIALPDAKEFLEKLSHSKEKTVQSLREKLHGAKLIAIKEELRNRGLSYDDSITDLNELKKSLKKNLSTISYEQVEDIYERVNKEYDKLLNDLEQGSLDATTKFLRSAEKITTPIAKSVAKSLASRTAIVLTPTIAGKLAVAGGLAAGATYKVVKSKKAGETLNQVTECDKILQEMEVTYSDGKVIDTRFNSEMQDEIRKFLASKKIEFNDTGYLSLREQIYSLSFENKIELCNLLNTKMNKGIEVNERIESKKGGFFDSVKSNLKKVRNSILGGTGVAAAVNTVDPAIIAGPLNGTMLGTLISKLTDSKIIQGVTGLFGGVGSAILERIPVIGSAAKSALAAESLLAGGIVGAGIGIAGLVAADIVKTVTNIRNKFAYLKDRKDILKYDSEKYAKEDQDEYLKMRSVIYNKDDNMGEKAIFQLVYEYMTKELNIEFKEEPKNLVQLSEQIEKLEQNQKVEVRKFIDKLIDYNKNNHSDFVNGLIKGGKTISTIAMLGLSGMSIYDLFKGGTFLPELSKKMFKNVPGNIYTKIPEKEAINSLDTGDVVPNKEKEINMIQNGELEGTAKNYGELEGMHYKGNAVDNVKEDAESFLNDPIGHIKKIFSHNKNTTGENVSTVHESPGGVVHGGGGRSFDTPTGEEISTPNIKFPDTVITTPSGEFTHIDVPPAPTKDNPLIAFLKTLGKLPEKIKGAAEAVGQDVTGVVDGVVGEREIVDKSAIEEFIRNMSDDELVNLAYYYNKSSEIDTSSVTYKTIGEVMAQPDNFNRINKAIEKYNETMKMIYGTSDNIKRFGEAVPIVEEVEEQIQKAA